MTCSGCKATVEKHLGALPNITKAEVDLKNHAVTLRTETPIPINTLQKALPAKFLIKEQTPIQGIQADKAAREKSTLKQLKPLFLIFAYILVACIFMQLNTSWNCKAFMLNFMGLFFIVFSFFKLLDLEGFKNAFKMYDPIAKKSPAYSLLYPFLEVTLGFLFLMRIKIPLALIITIVILGITTIGVTKALLNKTKIQCACLGTALKLPMTKATFIENSIMLLMAFAVLIKNYI